MSGYIGIWGWIKYYCGYKQLKVYYNKYHDTKQKNIKYWFPNYISHHSSPMLVPSPFTRPSIKQDITSIPPLEI